MPKSNRPMPVHPDSRPLLERILDAPELAHVVPQLQPDVLHRLIQRCGLEDSGAIIALATPEQLARVLDVDVWRAHQPGGDEHFDADRFGTWLETLLDSGDEVAAQTVARMNVHLVVAGIAQHALVFDAAAVSYATLDGEHVDAIRSIRDRPSSEVGGYLLVGRSRDEPASWHAIIGVLNALSKGHAAFFDRVMRGCRVLSHSGRELDGLDDLMTESEQAMFDLALDREGRRERQGFLTPPQARAFLQMSRQCRPGSAAGPRVSQNVPFSENPIARAYFRALDEAQAPPELGTATKQLVGVDSASSTGPSASTAAAVGQFLGMLQEEGLISTEPRALLAGAEGAEPRFARMQALMQAAGNRDASAFLARTGELAYLANAIAAGCVVQGRSLTPLEASDAAVAVCNLGLENWPGSQPLPQSFLVEQELVAVFQAGFTMLHNEVCLSTAKQLIDVLKALRSDDPDIQSGLRVLRAEMTKAWRAGTPWQASEALDVMTLLDMPAWAALAGLIAECPVIHAGLNATLDRNTRTVDASAFEFISLNRHVARVRDFMRVLPDTLVSAGLHSTKVRT